MESFVKDLYVDEIREGFLVTSARKRLWNVQIKLILEVARICRKHNIRWFAHGGTLLGAVRHKGFIPWDDDIDLLMLRPDYDKFMQVAPTELKPEYFLDNWSNHRLEEESEFAQSVDEKFPIISNEIVNDIRTRNRYWPLNAGYAKLRAENTLQIQWPERRNVHQGIWIDIFPYEPVPPFYDAKRQKEFEIAKELFLAVRDRSRVIAMLNDGAQFITPLERLKEILELPFCERARIYEQHLSDTYFESRNISWRTKFLFNRRFIAASCFNETIELPFEQISLSCPADYDGVLTAWYGDWREVVFYTLHSYVWSDNVSHKDYFAQVTR